MNKTLKRDCIKMNIAHYKATGEKKELGRIPAGSIVEITFNQTNAMRMTLTYNNMSIVCQSQNWCKLFNANPKPPPMSTMMKWEADGICKSLAGNSVEPDGWSFDGTPSWFLALGII